MEIGIPAGTWPDETGVYIAILSTEELCLWGGCDMLCGNVEK